MVTDICRECVHDEICKYKATCQAAQKAINDAFVHLESSRFIPIKDIQWIKFIEMGCEYFEHV